MMTLSLVGTIPDVDETTPDNPRHPSPVLLLEVSDAQPITRVVLPRSAWDGSIDSLRVGRRVALAAEVDMEESSRSSPPVACHLRFVDVD